MEKNNQLVCYYDNTMKVNPDVCAECPEYDNCPFPSHSGLGFRFLFVSIIMMAIISYGFLSLLDFVLNLTGAL